MKASISLFSICFVFINLAGANLYQQEHYKLSQVVQCSSACVWLTIVWRINLRAWEREPTTERTQTLSVIMNCCRVKYKHWSRILQEGCKFFWGCLRKERERVKLPLNRLNRPWYWSTTTNTQGFSSRALVKGANLWRHRLTYTSLDPRTFLMIAPLLRLELLTNMYSLDRNHW